MKIFRFIPGGSYSSKDHIPPNSPMFTDHVKKLPKVLIFVKLRETLSADSSSFFYEVDIPPAAVSIKVIYPAAYSSLL